MIRDVFINNITAVAEAIILCLISGIPGSRINDITLGDSSVEHNGGEQFMKERLPENLKG